MPNRIKVFMEAITLLSNPAGVDQETLTALAVKMEMSPHTLMEALSSESSELAAQILDVDEEELCEALRVAAAPDVVEVKDVVDVEYIEEDTPDRSNSGTCGWDSDPDNER